MFDVLELKIKRAEDYFEKNMEEKLEGTDELTSYRFNFSKSRLMHEPPKTPI